MLTFENGTDTLATVVSTRTLRARMGADTVGIMLIAAEQCTKLDNQ